MYIWKQNLADDIGKKHWAWHNRGAIYFSKNSYKKLQWEWLWQWARKSQNCAFSIDWSDEDGYGIYVAMPYLFCLWLHFNLALPAPPFRRDKYLNSMTIFGIRLVEEFIWIDFWNDNHTWKSRDRFFHHISIDWKKTLFGKLRFSKQVIDIVLAEITLPEGSYQLSGQIEVRRWERKRFIKPIVKKALDYTYAVPVPMPGKGENSWDIDDDAIYSGSINFDEGDTLEDVLAEMRNDILAERKRKGGPYWIPEILPL